MSDPNDYGVPTNRLEATFDADGCTVEFVPLMRPEVLACQQRAESLRVEADEAHDAAEFWTSLIPCPSGDHETSACEHPLCYDAWRLYL